MDNALTEFVTQHLDREEWWAVEASRDTLRGMFTPTGEHWRWREPHTDKVVELNPAEDASLPDSYQEGGGTPYLGSVEEYSHAYDTSGKPYPRTVLSIDDEVPTTIAGHIQNNDPAMTLADVEAKRAVVKNYQEAANKLHALETAGADERTVQMFLMIESAWGGALRCLANRWKDQPGFNRRWEL